MPKRQLDREIARERSQIWVEDQPIAARTRCAIRVHVEVQVSRSRRAEGGRVVRNVVRVEAQRGQAVVLQKAVRAIKDGGGCARDVRENGFVDLDLVFGRDGLVVGLEGERVQLGVPAGDPAIRRPTATAEQFVARAVGHHEFKKRQSGRVTAWVFVASEVGHLHFECRQPLLGKVREGQIRGVVAQQIVRSSDGRIEGSFCGGHTEGLGIVPQNGQHDLVAAHEVVLAVAVGREPCRTIGQHRPAIEEGHVAGLASDVLV